LRPPYAGRSGESPRDAELASLEAELFVADQPIAARMLAKRLELASISRAVRLIEHLNVAYDRVGSAFHVVESAGGYRLMTRPELRASVDAMELPTNDIHLTPTMLESLAVIAYRQPICRADVEGVRGVAAAEVLRQLLERGLIRIAGQDDSLGRPFLYGTTDKFLSTFGLNSLEDLPMRGILLPGRDENRTQSEPDLTDGSTAADDADAGVDVEARPRPNVGPAEERENDGIVESDSSPSGKSKQTGGYDRRAGKKRSK
jgi:segregation and condensation protein B